MRSLCAFLLALFFGCTSVFGSAGSFFSLSPDIYTDPDIKKDWPDLGLSAKSAVLMEASTGTILYEKNGSIALSPASITKIMTLILIFDALQEQRIKLTDLVTTSAYAKSMGGSQVFLEEGETQTVETMIKCIVIASGNDASVAMAEHIAGTETEFVRRMNERAKGLSMTDTHFVDCCGLTTDAGHLTSARDVAIMSRELITKYPEISKYSSIWMESITHVTRQGSKEFMLSNTNKLLKMNTSFTVTGLKTGSTSAAKYCVSATAKKDGVELIAVIMAADNYKLRFSEAQALLNYGFSSCKLYQDLTPPTLDPHPVSGALLSEVRVHIEPGFSYLSTDNADLTQITRQIDLPEKITAPIKTGAVVGEVTYMLGNNVLGKARIIADEDVKKAGFWDYFRQVLNVFSLFSAF